MKKYILPCLTILMATTAMGYEPRKEYIKSLPSFIKAIFNNKTYKVEVLLETNSDHANESYEGSTPLSLCLGPQRPILLMHILLKHRADPNARFTAENGRVFNELGAAFAYGTKDQLALLLEHKANPFEIEGLPQDLLKLMLPDKELEAKNALIDKAKRNWME